MKAPVGLLSRRPVCEANAACLARQGHGDFDVLAAGRGLFSFGTKREPERTAVPGGHESPSGAFKPQTGLRSKCRVFSAARARRFRRAGAGRGLFSFDTKREPEKCQRFRRAGPTRKGLLAPFNPKEDGLHTKKLAASLNAFLCSAISRPLSRCGGSSPQGSQRLQLPFAVTTPSREKENLKNPQIFQILKIKITFPLKMPRVKRRAFQIVRRLKGSPCKTKPFP